MTGPSPEELEALLPAITEILATQGVVLAYLHGSYALRATTPLSDLDIAVLLPDGTPDSEYASLLRDLTYDLSRIVPDVEVDLQSLDHAPVEFRYQVIKDGRVIYCLDDEVRASFETRTLIEYLDFKYALDTYYAYLHRRLVDGEAS